jgi:hypothetical protein
MEEAHRWSELGAGIDIERMLADTRIIAQEERLSGSPAERRAFAYIAQELEKVGAVTRWYEPEALISLPVRASLRLVGSWMRLSLHHPFFQRRHGGGWPNSQSRAGGNRFTGGLQGGGCPRPNCCNFRSGPPGQGGSGGGTGSGGRGLPEP